MLKAVIARVARFSKNAPDLMSEADEALVAARDPRVQLQRIEIRELVRALRRYEHCRFLVFGAGYDSNLWEALNAAGTTAFVEHGADWRAIIQPTLRCSEIHLVRYGTRLSEWKRLLHQASRMPLDLPPALTANPWDVILVDGPPGYAKYRDAEGHEAPGRMQSIFAASQLVAPNGYVFVHDCQRPAERAFAMRYLKRSRQFVQVKGWAELRGFRYVSSPVPEARAPSHSRAHAARVDSTPSRPGR